MFGVASRMALWSILVLGEHLALHVAVIKGFKFVAGQLCDYTLKAFFIGLQSLRIVTDWTK